MSDVEQSDERIKKDVIDHLFWSNKLDASNIKVNVNNKTVTLAGQVKSFRMKTDAEELVREIKGIEEIKNDIDVVLAEHVDLPDDEILEERIRSLLIWDHDIQDTHLEVNVSNRVVTVQGSVEEPWKERRAIRKAEELKGVMDVINEISVVPNLDLEDEAIADKMMDAFERNGSINPDAIEIRVENGEVYLEGTVYSKFQQEKIQDIAHQTPGVKRVIGTLKSESKFPASKGV